MACQVRRLATKLVIRAQSLEPSWWKEKIVPCKLSSGLYTYTLRHLHSHTQTSHKINKCKDQSSDSHPGDFPEGTMLCTVCTHQQTTQQCHPIPRGLFYYSTFLYYPLCSDLKESHPDSSIIAGLDPGKGRQPWGQRQRRLSTFLCASLPSSHVSYIPSPLLECPPRGAEVR